MADRPLSTTLPADLPTGWTNGQIIAPSGSSVGLATQYGYNYLMQQVNAAQSAANTINAAFDDLATEEQLPANTEIVYTLSASYSGTTHALTGFPAASGLISCVFTAAANYTAGDTFTVNGTPYTIQLSNGETAEDNLFVTGAAVPLIVDTGAKKVNFKAGGGAKRLITEIIMWDQNWVCPKGVTTINARLFGGGGGGGFESRGGAGGGGGHMAYKALSVTPGTSYPITIGTGGVGGSNGSAGGTTSFGSLLSASGGSGAQATVAGSGGTGGGGGYIREGGSGSYGGGGGGSTGGGGGDDGGDGGKGGPYGGGGGGAGAPNSVDSNVGRGGTGGENGGNGGNGGKYTSVAAQNGANGIDTTQLDVDFKGTGLGGAAGDGSGAYTGGGGGGGGYGGNGGNGGKHTSSVDGGGGGGGGYGGNGGNGGGDYGGGGGGYGGNGGPGGGSSTGGGGGGGYGPNGNGGSGEKNGYHHGGIAAGGSGGTTAATVGNGGQGICIITYMG